MCAVPVKSLPVNAFALTVRGQTVSEKGNVFRIRYLVSCILLIFVCFVCFVVSPAEAVLPHQATRAKHHHNHKQGSVNDLTHICGN